MKQLLTMRNRAFGLVAALSLAAIHAYAAAGTTTTTTLAVSAGGNPTAAVTLGTMVTLTATVQGANGNSGGGHTFPAGQVNFCDDTPHCTDIHLLGSAQLTSAGTAVLKLRPALGDHGLRAVFLGTQNAVSSSSSVSRLTVDGGATTTSIQQGGSVGNYTLTATVTGTGTAAPSGSMSFLDTTDSNYALATSALNPGTQTQSFAGLHSYGLGALPTSLVVGDFNGDGIPDVAAADSSDNTVGIRLGNGDGTFGSLLLYPGGNDAQWIAAGDFNGDGVLDLALANLNVNTVSVLMGNGDGSFAPQTTFVVGNRPTSVTIGDFNGDGILDLASANSEDGTVSILPGNGDGTFGQQTVYRVGDFPLAIVTGDFNGDGVLDLAVSYDGAVSVLLNDGHGSFLPQTSHALVINGSKYAIALQGMTAGDFNGDGIPDLAVAIENGGGGVGVFLSDGEGSFSAPVIYPVDWNSNTIATADFNGDGFPDLVVNAIAANTTDVLFGKGDGTFAPEVSLPTGDSFPIAAAATDLDGDGIPDIAIVDINYTVGMLLSKVTSTATATATGINPAGVGAHAVEASYPGDNDYTGSISTTVSLTGQAVTPVVSGISPNQGSTAGGTVVTLIGSNFTGATAIRFGQFQALNVTVVNASQIIATAPASAAAASVDVTVTTAGGTSAISAGDRFTYITPFDPAITVKYASTQLTYPGATNVTACIASTRNITPTGSVQILDGTASLATLPVQGGGCAYWYISPGLATGQHSLTAVYSGDKNTTGGTSAATVINVAPVRVNMAPACWLTNSGYGANYQCTVSLSSNAGAAQGVMTYSVDNGAAVSVPINNGTANFTVTRPAAGAHSVTIYYAQQTNYAAAGPATEKFTITPAAVYLALTPSSWYTSASGGVSFAATVNSSSAGAPGNNGSVEFFDGNTLLTTVPVNANGQAGFSTASLAPGQHFITATYSGGANYASGSSSVTITLTK